MAPFMFIGPGHPLEERMDRFRAAISGAPDPDGATVHTDLTLRDGAEGGLVLHRAYWSLQRRAPDGFAATTLSYHAGRDRATWLEFPDDPELPALADVGGEVLRYMPLRRCTAMAPGAIVKVKRPHRAAEAWALLGAVHRALGDSRAGFAVPAPLEHDPGRATFAQTVLEGDDLSALVDRDGGTDLVRRAGTLHRAMHAADVPEAPIEDAGAVLGEVRDDARWVAFALPEHAEAIGQVDAVLERRAPGPPPEPRFCHGDLVPSQMLVDGERWAITDFDGARLGDPHRDLAIWLAALTYDVPALQRAAEAGHDAPIDRAEAAYLEGYGAHDERRLLWHRAAAEVHYLAVALKKDRHHPARLARGLRVARACAQTLDPT